MVAQWVKDMCSDVGFASEMAVGKRVKHPEHGLVLITDGQYWGEHGLSNFWYWRKVNNRGVPYGKTYNGYGWM